MMVLLQVLKQRAILLIQQVGPPLGIRINTSKCEFLSQGDLDGFLASTKRSHESNFEILGAPIGDVIFHVKFLAQKRSKADRLLSQLSEVGALGIESMAPQAPPFRRWRRPERDGPTKLSMKSVGREGRVQFEGGFGEGVKS